MRPVPKLCSSLNFALMLTVVHLQKHNKFPCLVLKVDQSFWHGVHLVKAPLGVHMANTSNSNSNPGSLSF